MSTLFEYKVGSATTVTSNSASAQRPPLSIGRQRILLNVLGLHVKVLYNSKDNKLTQTTNNEQSTTLLQIAKKAATIKTAVDKKVNKQEFWAFQASLSTVSAKVLSYKAACKSLEINLIK